MPRKRFEYYAPETVADAVALLREKGAGACVMAGGTDLLVKMRHRVLEPEVLIGLKKINGLDTIVVDGKQGLTIGATALLADVAAHPGIQKYYPAVARAAGETANVQVRNMGTVVGNICNASPSADNVPILMVMDAVLNITGPEGERTLPLEKFFKGPGITSLRPVEIVTSVQVPLPLPGSGAAYISLSQRGRLDCSAVSVAALVMMEGKICRRARIAVGACAPVPMRAVAAEKLLQGEVLNRDRIEAAGIQASKETRPISDVRASAAYRWKMVTVLTIRALDEAKRAIKKSFNLGNR